MGLLILFGAIGLVIFILFKNIVNVSVIDSFGFHQYVSNVTHFYGGDRCVWVETESGDTYQKHPMVVYTSPKINSSIIKKIPHPVMVVYRGKESSVEQVVTEYNSYERPVRWSAVTIYQDSGVTQGYLKRGLDDSIHDTDHFEFNKKLDGNFSSGFIRYYQLNKDKLRGNRYSLFLNKYCEPSIVPS
ncbi:hypothetical protein SOPP22_13855 [Shewanella sp. OPT22]|nr:hypothetical protein SOPP22_13855 [Shewanella sp. OPT22]